MDSAEGLVRQNPRDTLIQKYEDAQSDALANQAKERESVPLARQREVRQDYCERFIAISKRLMPAETMTGKKFAELSDDELRALEAMVIAYAKKKKNRYKIFWRPALIAIPFFGWGILGIMRMEKGHKTEAVVEFLNAQGSLRRWYGDDYFSQVVSRLRENFFYLMR